MICSNCGQQIPENALVCPSCGTPVVPIKKPADTYEEFSSDVYTPTPTVSTITVDVPQQSITQKPWFKGVCIAVVVLICIVIAIVVASRSGDTGTTIAEQTATPTQTEDPAVHAAKSQITSDMKNVINTIDSVIENNEGTVDGISASPCTGTGNNHGVGSIDTPSSSAAYSCSAGVTIEVTFLPDTNSYMITGTSEKVDVAYTYDSTQGTIEMEAR